MTDLTSTTVVSMDGTPIKVNISDWLGLHSGRYSIGTKVNQNEALIYAYSDNEKDIDEMARYARKKKMFTFRSIPMGGITSFERIQAYSPQG